MTSALLPLRSPALRKTSCLTMKTLWSPVEMSVWWGTQVSPPTAMRVSISQADHPAPVKTVTALADILKLPWTKITQLSVSWIPDPWKVCEITIVYYCFRPLNFELICHAVVADKYERIRKGSSSGYRRDTSQQKEHVLPLSHGDFWPSPQPDRLMKCSYLGWPLGQAAVSWLSGDPEEPTTN